jgi:hypothetical protein
MSTPNIKKAIRKKYGQAALHAKSEVGNCSDSRASSPEASCDLSYFKPLRRHGTVWNRELPGWPATSPAPVIQGWKPSDYRYCVDKMPFRRPGLHPKQWATTADRRSSESDRFAAGGSPEKPA